MRARSRHKKTDTGFPVSAWNFFANPALTCFRSISAGSVSNVLETTVFFTVFLDQATSDQVLQLFVSTQTEHFFATAYRVASFQVFVDTLKQLIKAEGRFIGQNYNEFVGYMIGDAA